LELAEVSRSTWHYRANPRPPAADPVQHRDRAYRSRISTADRVMVAERVTAAWAAGNSVDHAFATAWDAELMLASRRSWWRTAADLPDQSARPVAPTRRGATTPREMPVLEATGPGQVWSWDITDPRSPWGQGVQGLQDDDAVGTRRPDRSWVMQRPHQVVVLVLDGALPLDVGIPAEVFHPESGFPYEVSACGVTAGTVPSHGGFGYAVPRGLDALADADTIVVPGYAPAGRPIPVEVREALRSAASRGARIASICYGAFALADAGLLDGLRATTHWDAAEKLAERHPQITVEPNVLFVDEGSILTSAGAAAGLDLCLHIVRRDLGVSAANEIARGLVTAPYRTGGQAQYLPKTRSAAHGETLAATREWAMTRLDQQLTIAGLAAHARMSPRTFLRRFAEETGSTPLQWILRARIDTARELLESTRLSVDRIADQVGLGTGSNLRLHFRRLLDVSPSEYRATFSGRS
jgi:transcriptional regulator GlxA family with amidase domain